MPAPPMRLAYSTNAFPHDTLRDALRAIATLGYEGVEILADHPHVLPGRGSAASLREDIASLGLGVSNVNANTARGLEAPPSPDGCGPTLVDPDPAVRARRLAHTRASLELAAAIGAPAVSLTTGPPPPDGPAAGRERFAEALGELLPAAQQTGVRLAVEYEPGHLVAQYADLVPYLDRFPSLGVNLDVGHAHVAGEDPAEIARRLGPRLTNLHVEDIRSRRHHHLVPGEGDIDFRNLWDALGAVDYRGFVTVELYTCANDPVGAGRRALAFLRNLDLRR